MLAPTPAFLPTIASPDGSIAPDRLSAALRVAKLDLARAAGLSRDAISKSARRDAPATQARLRDVAEIINRVQSWAGSLPMAFAWYRSQALPGFGDATAEDLVKAGRAEAVKRYLSEIAAGGYA